MREIGERWIEKHRRERERGRERQTDRVRDRQTTDKQTSRADRESGMKGHRKHGRHRTMIQNIKVRTPEE